jgi:hypothetical protein
MTTVEADYWRAVAVHERTGDYDDSCAVLAAFDRWQWQLSESSPQNFLFREPYQSSASQRVQRRPK